MLLNRTTLGLAKIAPKEASRYTLQAIAVEAECATVTNGHYLVTVMHGDTLKDEAFPEITGKHVSPNGKPILVSRDAALSALKLLPRKSNIPVLQTAAMVNDNKLYVTDLENVTTIDHKVEGTFPDWRRVMPKEETAVAKVMLNAAYLEQLAAFFREHGDNQASVTITLHGPNNPVELKGTNLLGQEITAVLMPYRAA